MLNFALSLISNGGKNFPASGVQSLIKNDTLTSKEHYRRKTVCKYLNCRTSSEYLK